MEVSNNGVWYVIVDEVAEIEIEEEAELL